MVRVSSWTAVALAVLGAACGEAESKKQGSNTGGAGGTSGASSAAGSSLGGRSGTAGASGGSVGANGGSSGSSGASAGTSGASAGTSSTGGSAGGASTDACPTDQVDCNGTCVGVGISGGGCTVLTALGTGVGCQLGMALDEQYVYWSEEGSRIAVARVPKAGGERQQLVECDDLPWELSVNSTSVFWSEGNFTTTRIRTVPKVGGTATDVLTLAGEALSVVANDTRVNFVTGPFGDDHDVRSVTVAGDDAITHGQSEGSFDPRRLVVTDSDLYWTSNGSEIRTATLTGTEQRAFAAADVSSMTRMGEALYVIVGSTGAQSIQRILIDNGQITPMYSGAEVAGRLAASDTTLYFATSESLYVFEMPATPPRKLLTTKSNIGFVVADASGVYIALNRSGGQGFIVKVQ